MWIDWLRKFLIGLGGTLVIALGISLFTTTTGSLIIALLSLWGEDNELKPLKARTRI